MTAPHVVDPAELTPVRDALLRIARADAEAVLAEADRETAELLASAEAEVAELLDRARARSREDAAELVAAQHSRMLREARSFELAARRSAYDALVAAADAAVRARLADDPEVLAALTARAHAELGPDATVTSSPDGGLVAEADGRRMGLPLTALAERAVAELLASRGHTVTGAIARVSGPLVEVEGLAGVAMFDLVDLGPGRLAGEVVGIRNDVLVVQAYEYTGGLRPGDRAGATGEPLSVPLGPGLLGGVFDGLLRPLAGMPVFLPPRPVGGLPAEGEWRFEASASAGAVAAEGDRLGTADPAGTALPVLVPPGLSGRLTWVAPPGTYAADAAIARVGDHDISLTERWPVRRPRPFRTRLYTAEPLLTGQRVVDLLFPVARGSAVGVPGGFGTGKTMLLQQIAKWSDADVIVYVGCGERGNEMAEVVSELAELHDPRTGGALAERTVVIANTSNMPMMARESSVYTGMTVAEYFRDLGRHVVVIADSTSRWAEALRELASRTGSLPAEEGYPADLASSLAAFYERAGQVTTLSGAAGSVTVIGAVSPPGGDLTEPVTSQTQRFVRCIWSLDHDLAYARHYPAVSWSGSFSRDADALAGWYVRNGDPEWARRRARMAGLLAEADRLASLAELVGAGSLPGHERVVMLAGRLLRSAVLQQNALSSNDASCGRAKSAALGDAVLAVIDRCDQLVESGVPATTVEEVDFGPLVRARNDTGSEDAEGVAKLRDEVLTGLEGLT